MLYVIVYTSYVNKMLTDANQPFTVLAIVMGSVAGDCFLGLSAYFARPINASRLGQFFCFRPWDVLCIVGASPIAVLMYWNHALQL